MACFQEKETYQILRDFGIDHVIEFSEDGGNLAHPVRTVVEKEKGIALCSAVSQLRRGQNFTLRTFDPSFVATDDNWLQELVRLILLISLLDGGDRILGCFALTLDQTLGSDLDSLPSLITVHGIVPADDGNEFSDLLLLDEVEEFLCILCGGTGSCVTTIAKEVDVDMWNFELFRGLEKCEEVVDVGMNTTIRDLQMES
jgi:hypothetical protein